MPTSDPLDILLAHNYWATRQVLEACEKLTPEQFHQKFQMGPGSLHDTLTHILGAMRGWSDVLAGRERPRLEARTRTVAELLELLEEIHADLVASARAHPISEVVTPSRAGKTYTFTRGGILTHVTTHGVHHRAQCLNMLRQLEATPAPATSVTEWMAMADLVR